MPTARILYESHWHDEPYHVLDAGQLGVMHDDDVPAFVAWLIDDMGYDDALEHIHDTGVDADRRRGTASSVERRLELGVLAMVCAEWSASLAAGRMAAE